MIKSNRNNHAAGLPPLPPAAPNLMQGTAQNAPYESIGCRLAKAFEATCNLNESLRVLRGVFFAEGDADADLPKFPEPAGPFTVSIDQHISGLEYQLQKAHDQIGSILSRV